MGCESLIQSPFQTQWNILWNTDGVEGPTELQRDSNKDLVSPTFPVHPTTVFIPRESGVEQAWLESNKISAEQRKK